MESNARSYILLQVTTYILLKQKWYFASWITAYNEDKRLIILNQIPQKRRLLDICDERKIKEAKLCEI